MQNNRSLLMIVLLIALAACCCVAAIGGLLVARSVQRGADWVWSANNEVTDTIGQTLEVGTPAALLVDVPIGSVEVRTGEPGRVTVEATRRAWGRNETDARRTLDRIDVAIDSTGAGVSVRVTSPDVGPGETTTPRTPQVDLVVTVPEQSQLDVTIGVGRVTVAGVRGDTRIKADVGEVTLRDVVPLATLEVTSRVASIDFEGALAEGAAYRLTSDVGRIALRLPPDSAFHVEARSDIGDAEVDFDVVGQSQREGFTGKEITGQVGADTGTELMLRSRVGDVRVQVQR